MGKGDKRTRRGKIFAGSFGKSRPKSKKANTPPTANTESTAKSKGKKEE